MGGPAVKRPDTFLGMFMPPLESPRLRPWTGLAGEWKPTLRLAVPVVLAELGWMGMGVVDVIMVGRLGPEAIGAVGLGNMMHFAPVVVAFGLLLGLDSLIARAFGEGSLDECHRWLAQGVFVSIILAVPMMGIVWGMLPLLDLLGVNPSVKALVRPYLYALNWSTLPLLVYVPFRRYSQSIGRAIPITIALVVANLINLGANALLIYGLYGFPKLGVAGSGWATVIARVGLTALLIADAFRPGTGLFAADWRPSFERIKRMLILGLPAAGQIGLEVGVFAAATALVATLNPIALAAHEIVLNISSVTFMVPLGVSAAGGVRIGQALGRRDPLAAARAGWSALALGVGFMALSAIAFWTVPRLIVGLYTDEISVTSLGIPLLGLAACFQLFDGLQVTITGILRGVGDTHTSMFANLIAHWVIGLPVGCLLCFRFGYGVFGIWIGLTLGIFFAGVILMRAWWIKSDKLV